MKRRNLLTSALVVACLLFSASALVSCGVKPESSSSSEIAQQTEIEQIYAQYVSYTETIGGQPLSYEAWLASIRGEDGKDGVDGKSAYQIWLENGYAGTQSDFLAWLKGEKGDKGDQGIQGDKGDKGDQGGQGVGIEKVECDENGNLVITYTDGNTQTVIVQKEEHTHDWDDGIVLKEATFAEEGAKIYICDCGEAKHEVIPKLYSNGLEYTLNEDEASYSVTGIGDCTDTNIVIPSTYENLPVTSIDYWAFVGCYSLASVTIGDSVTSIGAGAFSYCTSLTSVTIGDSVTSIGAATFWGCTSLTSIMVSGNNSTYKLIDGNLYTKDGMTLIQYAIGKTDTSFTIPDSVTSIGEYAFCSCSSLTSVVIPNSVTSIGSMAFSDCDSLTSVTIGDSVTGIGWNAFSGCISLPSVEIPDSVTGIGQTAFWGCASLTSITVSENNTVYQSIDGNLYTKYGELIQYAIGKTDTSFVIPIWVTGIGDSAFAQCYSLTSVEIPDSVTYIDQHAFQGCMLTSVVIPDSVTSIGDYAFSGTDLTSVEIPDSVTSIGEGAFFSCASLTSVEIPDWVTSIGNGAFEYCRSLTSVEIPDWVTSIGDYAFAYCDSLTSVVIPASVMSIGDEAFEYCGSLTDVYYKGTPEEWSAISIGWGNADLMDATRYYL